MATRLRAWVSIGDKIMCGGKHEIVAQPRHDCATTMIGEVLRSYH